VSRRWTEVTDRERMQEGSEEPIEDLEAPAESQSDVAGGLAADDEARCKKPSSKQCVPQTKARCDEATCVVTVKF
jgi:hypothetical protein